MRTEERIREAFEPFRSSLTLDEIDVARSPRPAVPTSHRRRRWAVSFGTAAVLTVLLLLVPLLVPLVGPGDPNPATASLLHRFARIARKATPETPPGPGEFVYDETLGTQSFVFVSGDEQFRFVYEESTTGRRWLGTDGSGRVVSDVGRVTFANPEDRSSYDAWVASGGPETDGFSFVPGRSVDVYSPGELMFVDTSELPTDPEALLALIEDREIVGGPRGDWETFVLAADLLRGSWARPALRAALYEVMARLPGIEVVGRATDVVGRQGIALASTRNGLRNEILFDEETGEILEDRTVVVERTADLEGALSNPGPTSAAYAAPGDFLYRATYVSFGEVVDSTTQTP